MKSSKSLQWKEELEKQGILNIGVFLNIFFSFSDSFSSSFFLLQNNIEQLKDAVLEHNERRK
jgi:hypothetical protein